MCIRDSRQTGRQTGRQTETERHKETGEDRDREAGRQTDRDTQRQRQRDRDRERVSFWCSSPLTDDRPIRSMMLTSTERSYGLLKVVWGRGQSGEGVEYLCRVTRSSTQPSMLTIPPEQ